MNTQKRARLLSPKQALGNYLDEMLFRATVTPAPAPTSQELSTEIVVSPAEVKPGPAATPEDLDPAAPASTPELEFPLQSLMFEVAGHRLSIPLIQLAAVISWNEAITRLPQSPPWMLGLIRHRESSLRIVDSRQLLEISASSDAVPEHLLVLGKGDWAISCDHLQQVENLARDDIQWRQDSEQQLTLGTIRESLAILLNPAGIVASLESRSGG